MSDKPLKVFFYVMDLVGPQNACIGLGQELIKRGHSVHFLISAESARMGRFNGQGFHVHPLTKTNGIGDDKDIIRQASQEFNDNGQFDDIEQIEKIKLFKDSNFFEVSYSTSLEYEHQIRKIFENEEPDVIVVDGSILPPSLVTHPRAPWVSLDCSTPLGLFNSPELPPTMSGKR